MKVCKTVLPAALFVFISCNVFAQDVRWTGAAPEPDDLKWSVPANWDTTTVPQAGDNVTLALGDKSVIYDETGAPGFSSLTIDAGMSLLHNAGTVLSSGQLYVGNEGRGYLVQSLGTTYVGVNPDLSLQSGLHELIVGRFEGASGWYDLYGTSALYVNREVIGDAGGYGSFSQTGESTHRVFNDLIIGQDFSGSGGESGGMYTLGPSAELTVDGNTYIGDQGGSGTFQQEGGTARFNDVYLGANSEDDSVLLSYGEFVQSSGVSNARNILLGADSGTEGSFGQTGGSVTATGGLTIGNGVDSYGEYILGSELVLYSLVSGFMQKMAYYGPELTVGHETVSGRFTQWEGTHRVIGDNGRIIEYDVDGDGYAEEYQTSDSGASLEIGADSVDTAGYEMNGGTLSVEKSLLMADEATPVIDTYEDEDGVVRPHLSWFGGDLKVGKDGNGEFLQTGGSVDVAGVLSVGAGGEGYYGISEDFAFPSLTSSELVIGDSGLFEQYGGTVTVDRFMSVSGSPDNAPQYSLYGGTLNKLSYETKIGGGSDEEGYFYQDGGTFTQSGAMYIGDYGFGCYELNSGIINADNVVLGEWGGRGEFLMYGGEARFNTLTLGRQNDAQYGPGDGYFLMDASSYPVVTANRLTVGQEGIGTFDQNAGSLTLTSTFVDDGSGEATGWYEGGDLVVGDAEGSTGTYNLDNGELDFQGTEIIGNRGNGTLNLSGISNNYGGLYVGLFHEYDSGGDMIVGKFGQGTVNLYDGSIFASRLIMAEEERSSGFYTMHAGGLNVREELIVGNRGYAEFLVDAGTVSANTIVVGKEYSTGAGSSVTQGGGIPTSGSVYPVIGANEVIGDAGTGFWTQTGGVNNAYSLVLGAQKGAVGTYTLSDNGRLVAWDATVGGAGQGYFNQAGPYNNATLLPEASFQSLVLGNDGGSYGRYDYNGSMFFVGYDLTVGNAGEGVFNHTGGGGAVYGNLVIAALDGSAGSYTMNAEWPEGASFPQASMLVYGDAVIGDGGTGSFDLVSGSLYVGNDLVVGTGAGGSGVFTQGADGFLEISGSLAVGGTGRYSNSGGSLTLNGGISTTAGGSFELSDAKLNVPGDATNLGTMRFTNSSVTFGRFSNSGALITDPTDLHVTDLEVFPSGYIQAGVGDSFNVSGNALFRNSVLVAPDGGGTEWVNRTNVADWDTGNAQLIFTEGAHQALFNSIDRGASLLGYAGNFAWGHVDFGGGSFVLQTQADGSVCALYTGTVWGFTYDGANVIAGFSGDSNIYYITEANFWLKGGTYSFGAGRGRLIPVTATPEPVSSALFLIGGVALALIRKQRV